MEFRTERLVLRHARPEDLDGIHAVLSNPGAMTYWSTLPHKTVDQSREWLAKMIAVHLPEGEDLIIERDGEVIGKAGLWQFPEIGFILHPNHWGRGYAQEALSLVLDRGFGVHGLAKIEADVDPRNLASLKLLRRLGFQETGRKEQTWHIGDQWCDSVYLTLDAAGWPTVT